MLRRVFRNKLALKKANKVKPMWLRVQESEFEANQRAQGNTVDQDFEIYTCSCVLTLFSLKSIKNTQSVIAE